MARKKRDEPAQAAAPQSAGAQPPPDALFPIVGIGASAGGLEAFKSLLAALAPDTGMAYVLIVHLPSQHDSMLSKILARISKLPLSEITDGVKLERNHVYVLPAGADASLDDGVIRLSPRQAKTGQHHPIDTFFRSLATHHGYRSIGVVLSGSASDGTLGIQEIKAAGGITFAQDHTAQQSSMPRSAIQTGAVDFVLPPEEIARELKRIATHPIVTAPPLAEAAEVPDLRPVIELLRESSGVDFTHYKANTLYRRIIRRLLLHRMDGLKEYMELLRASPAEADALYQDILINVTSFFRNPEAFEALKEEAFPVITRNRSRHDPVRIWTLGCSTGEEAYSLAMAFAEYAEQSGRMVPVQVFATDLNAACIDRARSGIYSRAAVAEVSPERLRRFFVEVDGTYRITKTIRETCIFARHNVLEEPPFSRIDLVSCRNMLIYLGPELQQKVMQVLYYALRPNGFLWLGASETIGAERELFELRNSKYKIYAKKALPSQIPAVPPRPLGATWQGSAATYTPAIEARPVDPSKDADRILAARYAPPSVLVRGDLEILQFRGDTSPFLAPAPGKASLNLLKMVREGLALGVRSAFQRAKSEEAPVRVEGVTIFTDGAERKVTIEVIPMRSGLQQAELFMVVFEELAKPAQPPAKAAPGAEAADAAAQETVQLKQELAATREYLQSVIEEQEAANEELQSANEEVQSSNEELQSINEELETSTEEVQSTNEELATVNDELLGRNAELTQINNDLVNLLSSVQLAIVMLGPNLRIRRFTPLAEKLLNLIPTDVGRPVSDIKINLHVPDLDKLVAEVMDSVVERELEVTDRQGRWYLLRMRPYRTLENKIDGAVIVLLDVDSLKRSQEMLRQQTELLNQAHEPILMWELDGGISYWNKAAEATYGFTRDQVLGRKPHELLLAVPLYDTYRDELHHQGYWTGELVHTRRDSQKIIVESRMVAVTDTQGRQLVVQADRPITERKETERILRNLADDLVAADAKPLQPDGMTETAAAVKPRRVLVVDDNADSVEATAMSLRLARHEVEVASNGTNALEVARAFKPEVALIDIAMPGVDGYELARQLRRLDADGLRLIAFSGYGDDMARRRAAEAGFDRYLLKPASVDEIQRIFETL